MTFPNPVPELRLKQGVASLVPSKRDFRGLVANSQSFLPSAVVALAKFAKGEASVDPERLFLFHWMKTPRPGFPATG